MSLLPLILGEAPSRGLSERWSQPLYGPTCRRLLHMMGEEVSFFDDKAHARLTQLFDVRNAIELYGQAYPWTSLVTREAQRRWTQWLMDRQENPVCRDEVQKVVCLGRKAAAATIVATHLDFFEWNTESVMCHYVVIPHPSGLNRLYNDPENVERARRVLLDACSRG